MWPITSVCETHQVVKADLVTSTSKCQCSSYPPVRLWSSVCHRTPAMGVPVLANPIWFHCPTMVIPELHSRIWNSSHLLCFHTTETIAKWSRKSTVSRVTKVVLPLGSLWLWLICRDAALLLLRGKKNESSMLYSIEVGTIAHCLRYKIFWWLMTQFFLWPPWQTKLGSQSSR